MNNTTIAKHGVQVTLVLALTSLASTVWAQTKMDTEKAIATAPRPDPSLRPPVAERRTVPLAAATQPNPSARRPSAQGLGASAQNIRTAGMVASACQGVAMSKEQARTSGSICAPAGTSPVQLAQAEVPQKTALKVAAAEADQLSKTAQAAAPEVPFADEKQGNSNQAMNAHVAGPVPVAMKAGPGGVESIPTLSEWGVLLLAALLGVFGLRQTGKRGGKHLLPGVLALVLGGALMATGSPANATTPDVITYLHTDVSGSPLAATDATGAVVWKESYRAYGERAVQQAGTEQQTQWFHGKEQDSTGLQYFGARYYDPVVGRFMGVDPVDFQEGNLHSFNRYAYGNNNPNRYVDPDGRHPILWAVFEAVTWLGARQAATLAVVEAGAMVAAGASGPGIAGAEVMAARVASSATKGAGSFISVSESMSANAAAYQARVAGTSGSAYVVNGVKFDGFANGILIDAKAGYAQFVKDGQFRSWFSGADGFAAQAQRQLGAANGAPIQWRFAEESAANATKTLFQQRGISGSDIVHVP